MFQDDYTQKLPPIHQLLSEFHVNSDIAFFLARPMFNYLIRCESELEPYPMLKLILNPD